MTTGRSLLGPGGDARLARPQARGPGREPRGGRVRGGRVLREGRAAGAGRAVLVVPRRIGRKPKPKGGLNLTTRAGLLTGGDSGPSVVEGKPEESLLIRAIRYHDEPRMPPEKRLGEFEIQNLGRWVELGLPWPSSTGTAAVGRRSRGAAIAGAIGRPTGPPVGSPRPRPLGLPPGGRPALSRRSATGPGRSRRSTRSSWPGWSSTGWTRARGRPADPDPPRHVRPHRTAPRARGGRGVRGRRSSRGLRTRSSIACWPALIRRAMGTALARRGQLCRHRRRDGRLSGPRGLSLPRLRRRGLQPGHALQRLPHRADRRRRARAEGPADRLAARIIATGFLALARRFGFDPRTTIT